MQLLCIKNRRALKEVDGLAEVHLYRLIGSAGRSLKFLQRKAALNILTRYVLARKSSRE